MARHRALRMIEDIVSTINSAVSVAGAVEGRHVANSRHLRNLGIDPAQFNKIGR